MAYIQGENREQLTLTPMCLDDYIGKDSICRVIEAFVIRLDLAALGFKYATTKAAGRLPYDPAKMLELYIYGYMNRVSSSRRLEAETQRNIEVMWLMDKLTPDDKTICNFRKDNAVELKKVFREFSLWCSRVGLYGKDVVAVDGTKIRASANRRSIHTKKGTEKQLAAVDEKINKYLKMLEENDAEKADDVKLSSAAIQSILTHLNKKKDKLTVWQKRIEDNGGIEISTIDPDARIMHTNGDGRELDACYNVQTVVDSKNKLIVDFEVTTCANDKGALPKMTEAAKEIMGVSEIAVVADKGYYDGEDIAECDKNGTTAYVPKVNDYAHAPDVRYDHSKFKYDAKDDCYTCPEKEKLHFRHGNKRGSGIVDRLYGNPAACKNCPSRNKCFANERGYRPIIRTQNQDALDKLDARMRTTMGREIFRERKKIVEHPFGTTKAVWGYRQFLCRTKERVTAEQSLRFLAYNLRRVINIFERNGGNLLELFTSITRFYGKLLIYLKFRLLFAR